MARTVWPRGERTGGGAELAQAQRDAATADYRKPGEEHTTGQNPAIYRPISRHDADVSRVSREGEAESAAMAASSLCGAPAGRHVAGWPGKSGRRLYACLRSDDSRSGGKRRPRP